MSAFMYVELAWELEKLGLLWQPSIGDEVSNRKDPSRVSILVDPNGLTPSVLRDTYLWLPTVEQLVLQLESRQAILFHAGMELTEASMHYKAVVRAPNAQVEGIGDTLRAAVGVSLRDLLRLSSDQVH